MGDDAAETGRKVKADNYRLLVMAYWLLVMSGLLVGRPGLQDCVVGEFARARSAGARWKSARERAAYRDRSVFCRFPLVRFFGWHGLPLSHGRAGATRAVQPTRW